MNRKDFLLGSAALLGTRAYASPIRSLVGGRILDVSKQTDFTASDYVQDGLVVMYDAIENAGFGQHDSMRRLVDLCGDSSFTMSARYDESMIEFGEDFVQILDSFPSGKSFPITTSAEVSLVGRIMHSEVCMTNFVNYGNINIMVPYEIGLDNRVYFNYGTYWIYAGTASSSVASYSKVSGDDGGGTYSFSYQNSSLENCITMYRNAVNIGNRTGKLPRAGYGGGVGKIGSWNFYGTPTGIARHIKFHNLRFYDRNLTTDEIAWNYKVDKARFKLP